MAHSSHVAELDDTVDSEPHGSNSKKDISGGGTTDTAGSNKEDPAVDEIDTARSGEQESGAKPYASSAYPAYPAAELDIISNIIHGGP